MRYLETCVAELKEAHRNCQSEDAKRRRASPREAASTYSAATTARTTPVPEVDYDDEEASDEEMTDDASYREDRRHHYHHTDSRHARPSTISPAILPSATTSPLFSMPPQQQSYSALSSPASYARQQPHQRLPSLSLASPMLQAQQQQQHLPSLPGINTLPREGEDMEGHDEATASALLMLNTDRRSWTGRGMSVKDLLSTQ